MTKPILKFNDHQHDLTAVLGAAKFGPKFSIQLQEIDASIEAQVFNVSDQKDPPYVVVTKREGKYAILLGKALIKETDATAPIDIALVSTQALKNCRIVEVAPVAVEVKSIPTHPPEFANTPRIIQKAPYVDQKLSGSADTAPAVSVPRKIQNSSISGAYVKANKANAPDKKTPVRPGVAHAAITTASRQTITPRRPVRST